MKPKISLSVKLRNIPERLREKKIFNFLLIFSDLGIGGLEHVLCARLGTLLVT